MYKKYFKRFFDVIISAMAIIIFTIPMIFIAIAIKIDSEGPVLFKQERIGLNGKVFEIYKFRSMCINAEHIGSGVYSEKGDPRVTKIGRFLRATSLDELPQLFNIIQGTMSLLGPRPPLKYHPWPYDEYTDVQKRMFELRPGVSGWAQVNGRKEVEWNERIRLNVWYVDNVSFGLDIKILFMTFFKVITNANNENKGKTVKSITEEKSVGVSEESSHGIETNVHN